MGFHCLPRPEILNVNSFRLFCCFKLAKSYYLLICSEHAKLFSGIVRLSKGQPSETFSLPLVNSILISLTILQNSLTFP